MCDTCGDNRFELIEKYKQKLIESTNISDSPEEMAVIDNILFRFWQMGWLKGELFGNSEQLESCVHEKDHVADPGKMVGDLISRAKVIETVRKAKSIGQAHRMLVQLPSAQPDIIACGDCKHWICHDRRCGFWNHGVKPLDWCCHAERRSDG